MTYGFSLLKIVARTRSDLRCTLGESEARESETITVRYKLSQRVTTNFVDRMILCRYCPKFSPQQNRTHFRARGSSYATQFSQPALVILQKAAFEMLRHRGFIPPNSMFAGHSLGEYAGLSSYADVLTTEDLSETVFLRGMIMQSAVERDAEGRSDYAMVAANPKRVGAGFEYKHLVNIVDVIDSFGDGLIQIVNYNVMNYQYVVAGCMPSSMRSRPFLTT